MKFFCFQRDRPGAFALRMKCLEDHWSYLERWSEQLVVRGPTFEGDVPSGSVYIVDVATPAEARAFVFEEPAYQAGVYRDVLLRRWQDALHRTTDGPRGDSTAGKHFLVVGLGAGVHESEKTQDTKNLVAFGTLLSDDASKWLGTAALLQAPDADAASAILTTDRYSHIEVCDWQFGGRR
ncbi:YciI family protein [uncultured Jatrophihabitans sp.]|uniref:YciI family protein n=1 Tax=uncultured Jatrophihabitans sp. TaxID=1610747 RepID=UPI0035C98884